VLQLSSSYLIVLPFPPQPYYTESPSFGLWSVDWEATFSLKQPILPV